LTQEAPVVKETTQEVTAVKEEPQELFTSQKPKQLERKRQASIQELVESLKSTADDIGQISELSSEEKILVTQFFSSLLKLMQPLSPAIAVEQSALPVELSGVVEAHIDPTGHLILLFQDDHVELKDLSEEKNRDLMTAVIEDVMPKFKSLASMQKRKLENRIKLLSSITKEIQKSSEALSAALSAGK
jgi:proline dehydrogenase